MVINTHIFDKYYSKTPPKLYLFCSVVEYDNTTT